MVYKPQPGYLGNLTHTQQHALDTLKNRLPTERYFVPNRMDDSVLLRFLRECNFNVEKTNAMLLSAARWRQDFKADGIVKEYHLAQNEVANKNYPQYYHKTAKDGRPVYIERLGKIGALEDTSQEFLLRRFVLGYETFFRDRLPACTQAAGYPIETSCTIMDMDGVGLGLIKPKFIIQMPKLIKFVSQTAKISRECYPGTTSDVYIVNVPSGFPKLWDKIKEKLDEKTAEKIHVVKANQVREKLLEQISAQNLPAEFGGTCRCPGGCASGDAGPW